jgi:hypothetical protein
VVRRREAHGDARRFASMMRGRLNLFQSSMLRWRELHPYCASHVIAIDAPLDETRLRAAITGVVEACGLTGLHLDADRRRFEFEGGPAVPALQVLDAVDVSPFDVAASQIEATINAPFPRTGRFDPFRFFAIRAGEIFLLGLTYDHFIAGGDSIAVLVTDIADRYVAHEAPVLSRLERYPPAYARLFARHAGQLARGLTSLPGLLAGWRSAIRPRVSRPSDGHNGFAHFGVEAAHLARLRAAATRWDITLNDLLLALVLRAVAPIASQRHHTGRRTQVALALIVNVRADFQPPASKVFGQFLSSFRVVHPLPQHESIEVLARALSAQTARAKRLKLYLVTLLAMGAATLIWPFATAEGRHRLYLKYHPVFAGVTPLNVNALRRRGQSRDGDYLRAASTGPMSPMVVAVSTAGAAARIGITFRTTALTRADVDAVIASIEQDMDSLS